MNDVSERIFESVEFQIWEKVSECLNAWIQTLVHLYSKHMKHLLCLRDSVKDMLLAAAAAAAAL